MSVVCLREVPDFAVRYKDKSWSQRLLGLLSYPFNRKYMTDYITTLYPYVYFPGRPAQSEDWKVLAHEYVHLYDMKRHPLLFRLGYAFPQMLGIFSLGALFAFLTPWALLCLTFLLALAPWPSPGRTDAEMRGYAMSMAVNYWRYGYVSPVTLDWVTQQFIGWPYYRMAWGETLIRMRLDRIVSTLVSGTILTGDDGKPFRDVYAMLQEK